MKKIIDKAWKFPLTIERDIYLEVYYQKCLTVSFFFTILILTAGLFWIISYNFLINSANFSINVMNAISTVTGINLNFINIIDVAILRVFKFINIIPIATGAFIFYQIIKKFFLNTVKQKNFYYAISWMAPLTIITFLIVAFSKKTFRQLDTEFMKDIMPFLLDLSIFAMLVISLLAFLLKAISVNLPENLKNKPDFFMDKLYERIKFRIKFSSKQLLKLSVLFASLSPIYFLVINVSKDFFPVFSILTSFLTSFLNVDVLWDILGREHESIDEETKKIINLRLNGIKFIYFLILMSIAFINYLSLPDFIRESKEVESLPMWLQKWVVFAVIWVIYAIIFWALLRFFDKVVFKKKKISYNSINNILKQSTISDLEGLKQLQKITNETVEKLQVEKLLSSKFLGFQTVEVISYKKLKLNFKHTKKPYSKE